MVGASRLQREFAKLQKLEGIQPGATGAAALAGAATKAPGPAPQEEASPSQRSARQQAQSQPQPAQAAEPTGAGSALVLAFQKAAELGLLRQMFPDVYAVSRPLGKG